MPSFAITQPVPDNCGMRHQVKRLSLHDDAVAQASDLAYWLRQSVSARLAAVEALRQQHIESLPDAEPRLQRVCRVAQLKQR
jgi:hypothetical protein